MPTDPLYGCDELRRWLRDEKGFVIHVNHLAGEGNECNWLATGNAQITGRKCETNRRTPQIVVYPYQLRVGSTLHESAEVDLTGEVGGGWFKLRAYSLTHDELRDRLDDIEQQLVTAWNALGGGDDGPTT